MKHLKKLFGLLLTAAMLFTAVPAALADELGWEEPGTQVAAGVDLPAELTGHIETQLDFEDNTDPAKGTVVRADTGFTYEEGIHGKAIVLEKEPTPRRIDLGAYDLADKTITFSMKTVSFGKSGYPVILGNNDSYKKPYTGFDLSFWGPNPRFEIQCGDIASNSEVSQNIPFQYEEIAGPGPWTNIAIVFDQTGKNVSGYQDGKLVRTNDTTAWAENWMNGTAATVFHIGNDGTADGCPENASKNFKALMDNFKIFDKPLTAQEVAQVNAAEQIPVDTYTLTAQSVNDSQGTASVTTEGGALPAGERVTVRAQAKTGFRFSGWSAQGVSLTPEQEKMNPLTFEMPAENVTVTASFEAHAAQELLVPLPDVLDLDFSTGAAQDLARFWTAGDMRGGVTNEQDAALGRKVMRFDGQRNNETKGTQIAYTLTNEQLGKLTTNFTFETAFQVDALRGQAIVANSESGGFDLEMAADGTLYMYVYDGKTNAWVSLDTKITAGPYYHVMATYDGADFILYINGQQVKTLAKEMEVKQRADILFSVGSDPNPTGEATNPFQGKIANVGLYSRALSAQEVADTYEDFTTPPQKQALSAAAVFGPAELFGGTTVTYGADFTTAGGKSQRVSDPENIAWSLVSAPAGVSIDGGASGAGVKIKVENTVADQAQFQLKLDYSGADGTFTAQKSITASNPLTGGGDMKIGVISDTQLNGQYGDNRYTRMQDLLRQFKAAQVGVIMMPGDITDAAEEVAYDRFLAAYKAVYPDDEPQPVFLPIMGNHDMWTGRMSGTAHDLTLARTRFKEKLGVDSQNVSTKVNGYHFIGLSTDSTEKQFYEQDTIDWFAAQLAAAAADDPNKPIFVMTHENMKGTVFTSNEWGNGQLGDILAQYPQVVHFSGHAHFPIDDERSIYQKDYTAVATSAVAYLELESGKDGGTKPPGFGSLGQGMIVTAADDAVTIERRNAETGEKLKVDWVIPVPIQKENFTYTDARAGARTAPAFAGGAAITPNKLMDTSVNLSAPAAAHDDFVYSYRLELINESTYATQNTLYFSDWYLGVSKMKDTVEFALSGLTPETDYTVNLYAQESFGKESAPISLRLHTQKEMNKRIVNYDAQEFYDAYLVYNPGYDGKGGGTHGNDQNVWLGNAAAIKVDGNITYAYNSSIINNGTTLSKMALQSNVRGKKNSVSAAAYDFTKNTQMNPTPEAMGGDGTYSLQMDLSHNMTIADSKFTYVLKGKKDAATVDIAKVEVDQKTNTISMRGADGALLGKAYSIPLGTATPAYLRVDVDMNAKTVNAWAVKYGAIGDVGTVPAMTDANRLVKDAAFLDAGATQVTGMNIDAYSPGEGNLYSNVYHLQMGKLLGTAADKTAAAFDANAPADLSVTLEPGSHALDALRLDGAALRAGNDYTVLNNVYTIKQAALAVLSNGSHTLTFDMDSGADPAVAITVTNSGSTGATGVKVGILSDTQLLATGSDPRYERTRSMLQQFKDANVDVILMPGDITDAAEAGAYDRFLATYKSVFPEGQPGPVFLPIMGNHDFWNTPRDVSAAIALYEQKMGRDKDLSEVVKGYHFIGLSSDTDLMAGHYNEDTIEWFSQQLAAAAADDPNKPIFVMTHENMKGTVFTSDDWGNDQLLDILAQYPQVVLFSGHAHFPIDDERSIHQRDFTSVATSAIAYVELESGKEGGTKPPGYGDIGQGMLMTVDERAVTIERRSATTGEKLKEDWVIPVPVQKENFTYTDARADARTAPAFAGGAALAADNITKSGVRLSAPAAAHDDFVYSYRLELTNKKTNTKRDYLYFSDWYAGISNMADSVTFGVTGLTADTDYEANLYAQESFGKESAPITVQFRTKTSAIDPGVPLPEADVLDLDFSTGQPKNLADTTIPITPEGGIGIGWDDEIQMNVANMNGGAYSLEMSQGVLDQITNELSVEAVFRADALGKTQDVLGNSEYSGISFEITAGGDLGFWIHIGGAWKSISAPVQAGEVYHVLGTYDGSAIRLYLNGDLVAEQAQTGAVLHKPEVRMMIGAEPSSKNTVNTPLNGVIAFARLYGAGLDESQAAKCYSVFESREQVQYGKTGSVEGPAKLIAPEAGAQPLAQEYQAALLDKDGEAVTGAELDKISWTLTGDGQGVSIPAQAKGAAVNVTLQTGAAGNYTLKASYPLPSGSTLEMTKDIAVYAEAARVESVKFREKPANTQISVPQPGESAAIVLLRAVALDQNGQELENTPDVGYSIVEELPAGAAKLETVTQDGKDYAKLSVTSAAFQAEKVTVKAYCGGKETQLEFKLVVDSKPSKLEIVGESALNVGSSTDAAASYQVKLTDQYGQELETVKNVKWSLESGEVSGVSIDTEGNLRVKAPSRSGDVTLKAELKGETKLTAQKTIAIKGTLSGSTGGGSSRPGGSSGGSSMGVAGGGSQSGGQNPPSQPNQPQGGRPGGADFGDLPAGHWAAEAVYSLAHKGVISGDSETGNIRPEDNITREETVKVLLGALGKTVQPGSGAAQDGTTSDWAKDYMAAAQQAGIVQGDGSGNLLGAAQISRVDAMVMIARALGAAGGTAADLAEFSDRDALPDYAVEAVASLVRMGIVSGYEDGTIGAQRALTRAELFALMDRISN